jgi:thiosulfate dehydrogenase [quinone] large subunit
MSYFEAVSKELKKDWKTSILALVFTVARLIYGWSWFSAGLEKISWLTNGKFNSGKEIQGLINNIAGPKVTRFDPLGINHLFAWLAHNIFLNMGGLTDALVVICEMVIGLLIIFGFKVFWSALLAMFLNLQYIAAGSFNNFGYIWTNLAFLKFAKYAELLGIDGFIRYKKGKQLL